jgi:DivIVA domain-containing protein
MDLTPQLFRDVQFTERRGAYDKDEVNAFLSRVGTAVGQLQERARDAHRRVEAAEQQIAKLEAAAREQKDADETLRRTLVLAQRTADAAVQEANEEADAIVAAARKRADEMIVQAEEAVRRDVGATRDRLEAEIRELEGHRDELRERIDVLGTHLESERGRLRGELDHLRDVLDDPERLVVAEPPGAEPEPLIILSDSTRAAAPAPVDEPAPDLADEPDDADLAHLPPPPEDWSPTDQGPGAGTRTGAAPSDDLDPDSGPPTEAHPVVGAGPSSGGSHLDELRRAVRDDTTDPEADAAMAAFFDQDTDDEPSRRFGRRR